MVLVTTVVLANHGSFTSTSLLRTQAYDMALRMREAQQSAVSSQGEGGDFSSLFGIRWSHAAAVRDQYDIFTYPFFADPTGTQSITPSQATVFGATGLLDDRFAIICVQRVVSGTPQQCMSNAGVHIVFKRPNFDALFYDRNGARLTNVDGVIFTIGRAGETFDAAAVGTSQRSITITSSGQITVQ